MKEHVHLLDASLFRRRPVVGDHIHLVDLLVAELFLVLRKLDGDRASNG